MPHTTFNSTHASFLPLIDIKTAGGDNVDRTQRCPECGEVVSLGKLRRLEARVTNGTESNPHVLAFAATPALQSIMGDVTYVAHVLSSALVLLLCRETLTMMSTRVLNKKVPQNEFRIAV